ncbi:hypothetical protein HTZ84_20755 [Haloterrigena sp. SYSU A558-1]|uniref:Uncharacterized protein n=1 Tax=Haloterrigena gelatinilytica TaxID=2741724 RepID=A0A8J8KDC3_9EURY|nr:hypothetical protein [Haloterrigena gelatinilytica]NUB89471.1 hypothetical protein [Haloterrigena gelatinilytica]NUC74696.1 hypothetical protein [Haloterrigena gelatinilytica]
MQVTAIREAECPQCKKRTSIPVPVPARSDDRASARLGTRFGERRSVTCPDGHSYWVAL